MSIAKGDEGVDVSEVPERIGNALGMSGTQAEFVGGLIASSLLMAFFILPTLVLTKGKSTIAVLFIGFMSMTICIALTWLPYWILLFLSLIIAIAYGNKIMGLVK